MTNETKYYEQFKQITSNLQGAIALIQNDKNYENIGRLKWLIDNYASMVDLTNSTNEINIVNSYYSMLNVLATDYTDDDLSDVQNDYDSKLREIANTIKNDFDKYKRTDDYDETDETQELINFIGSYDLLFVEMQIIEFWISNNLI